MRIARLELKAFGPFTERALPLGPGLHLIYGSNEAGKSSTLRALKAWLFGFPERTTDNFLHANEQLLVGGCLQLEDGRELTFYRRKKRKAAALDPEGNPLAAGELAAFLPIREQTVFESLYGLSHEDLIRGGEEILAQKGEAGQALFAAGAGISSLCGVLSGLESDAESLFKVRGAKQEINEALAAYQQSQKIVRDNSLSSRDWHELSRELNEAQEALVIMEELGKAKGRRLRQLERLRQLFPQLALKREIQQQLAELAEVTLLPDDFSTRRQQLEKALHTLARREMELAGRLAQRGEIPVISPYQAVLDAEEAIEDLHQRLGGYNKGRIDQPKLEGMRISHKKEAAELLKTVRQDLSLDQVEILRPVAGRKKLIELLASRHEGLQKGITQTNKDLLDIQRQLSLLDKDLAMLPKGQDISGLGRACNLARKAGAIDEDLTAREELIEDKKSDCLAAFTRLSLCSGSLEQLLSLSLPLSETVRGYDSAFQRYAEQQRDQRKEEERLQKKLAEKQAGIWQLEASGNTPTEDELLLVRTQRDQGWALIRRQWLGGEVLTEADLAFTQNLPLPEAYEKKVGMADTLADRLRHDADRVQAFSALRAEQQSLSEALVGLKKEEEKNNLAFITLEANWRQLWQDCAISPLSPKEMLAWLVEASALRDRLIELQATERDLGRRKAERTALSTSIVDELLTLSEECASGNDKLEPLLLKGEAVLNRQEEIEKKRVRLLENKAQYLQNINLAQERVNDLSQELAAWRLEWQEVVADLVGQRKIYPAEVVDLLDNLQNCFIRLKETEELHSRITGIARDNLLFEKDALDLARRIEGTGAGSTAAETVAQLKTLLNQARTEKTLRDGHLAQEKKEAEEKRLLTEERQALEYEMTELCRLAGRVLPEELEMAENRSGQYLSLAASLAQTERSLIEGADGLPLIELESQAATIDPDELAGEITMLHQEIEMELTPEKKRLSELIGEKKNQLRQMDGNARAAEAAEEGARLLARIQRLAERYIQLKVAGHVLKNEIERYRRENQGPVLAITSRYFNELTLGSFAGLLNDENDQGEPVLVGIRANGIRVLVERMSSGTRDQLYLALRLASLECRFAGHEPMPLILDDILVNADDARSRVALKILGGLAAKTQVILFTHHRRLVDEASLLSIAAGLQVHEL